MAMLEQRWETADDAVRSGDYARAVSILESLASEGNWVAYAELGNLFEHGPHGVPQDYERALYWYRRAMVEADTPHAHLGLARMYFYGLGVPTDHSLAREHARKALSVPPPVGMDVRGRILAMLILGRVYRDGIAGPRDSDAARTLYEEGLREELPAVVREHAQLEFEDRNYVSGFVLLLRAIWIGMKLGYVDRQHPKLAGIAHPNESKQAATSNVFFLYANGRRSKK